MNTAAPRLVLCEPLLPEQQQNEALRDRAHVSGPASLIPRFYLDLYWVDDRHAYLRGFLFVAHTRTIALRHTAGGTEEAIHRFPREDIAPFFPDCVDADQAGFSVLMPFHPGAPLEIELATTAGTLRLAFVLAGRSRVSQTWKTESAYLAFVARANRAGARILEIGSRLVGQLSHMRSEDFPLAAQYVGIDIHPGTGVHVVCDAHRLSRVFRPASFDYAFSSSVLEHLPAPWRLGPELNRVLPLGGEVFHSTPFCFPLHETPNDFWRFSDKGLELIFGPDSGFEILGAGLACEVRCIPEWRDVLHELPLNPGYTEAWILARKVAELPDSAEATAETAARSRSYPSHEDDEEQRRLLSSQSGLPWRKDLSKIL